MIQTLNFSIRQRIKTGFTHTVYGLSGNVVNFLYSILLIRWFALPLWGSFAQLLLVLTLCNQLTSWGNRDFLLREFSRHGQLSAMWQTSFFSRTAVLVLLVPLVFLVPITEVDPWLFFAWLTVSFVHRSFDSAIVFERKFREAILIEATGFLATLLLLFALRSQLNLVLMVVIFIAATLLRVVLYAFLFRKTLFQSVRGEFSFSHLMRTVPFVLPSFFGLMQAKADTLVISIKLSRAELGEYYVLLSLLSYCHAIPVLTLTPFLKNLYRISRDGFQKTFRTFVFAGISWSILCMTGIYVLMEFVYRLHLPIEYYFIAWLAVPPYFAYFLMMQRVIRNDRPYTIVFINLVAAAANFALSFYLVGHFGFKGGLIANAVLQWLVLAGYFMIRIKEPTAS